MILALWMPLVLSLVLWCAFEQLLLPRPRPNGKRPAFTSAIDIGSWALLYGGFVLLLQRPWFAMVVVGALHMVIIQVSNTKARTLREPFLCQDFEYFVDMVKHPRLYLPFFGIGLAIASTLAGIAAIVAGFWLEPSILLARGWQALTPVLATLIAGSVALRWGLSKSRPTAYPDQPPLDPNDELVHFGFTTLLWRQGRELVKPLAAATGREEFRQPMPQVPAQALPNVVIVQSESFFDPRRWSDAVREQVLAPWDKVATQSLVRGPLDVPAWGANTVRSECAFLTGLRDGALAGHRFNPYHSLSHQQVPSLIQRFKALGYRTLCIHPYPKSFYFRDKVFPLLGFDEFIDGEAFDEQQKDGQYIADAALADKVQQILTADDQPTVVMLITMENHGPLHLERQPEEPQQWLHRPLDKGCEDLSVYLRHLHNGARMVERLATTLQEQQREGILCFYGDHVPIMDKTYQRLGEPDGFTDYFIWSTSGAAQPSEQAMNIADLGPALLNAVLASTHHGARSPGDARHNAGSGYETFK
ncbi:LTA synthase family protein [Carnimonas bestiolae]|uniref:LTA synthase family protein n=1 Tax=Carnimonas bestiolae TaxID=3402172 RepID=UPI003EDC9FCC